MIVELFGAPAAGKTTLAYALAASLTEDGRKVELVLSSRPAERDPIRLESARALSCLRAAAVAPLSRGAKLLTALPILLGARHDSITANLMDLMRPRGLLWSVRYRRYLCLLSSSWQKAAISDHIGIFDQGFLTAVCSLALLSRCSYQRVIGRGLELIPRPNLLIHVAAPRQILEARLRQRLGRQGAIERLFEFDLKTNLQQIETTSEVVHMLQQQGFPILQVSCLDRRQLEGAVKRIMREVKLWRQGIDARLDQGPCLFTARRQGGGGDRANRYHAGLPLPEAALPSLYSDGASSELSDDAQL